MKINKELSVLLVEDNEDDIHFIKKALNNRNYQISELKDGKQALDYLMDPNNVPDIVLLDYRLPFIDGMEIIEKTKKSGKDIAYIFLTVDTSIDTAVEAMKAGAMDFLPKTGKFYDGLPDMIEKVHKIHQDRLEKKRIEEKYRHIFENIQDVYYEATLDGIIQELSPSIEKISKFKREELINKPLNKLFINSDQVEQLKKNLLSKGKLHDFEIVLRDKNGVDGYCSLEVLLVKDKDGNPIKIIGSIRDITDRKKADQALQISEERLKLALEGANEGLFDWNIGTEKVFFNKQWAEMLGYDLKEIEATITTWRQLVHPEDIAMTEEIMYSHFEGKTEHYETKHRMKTNSGDWKWVLSRGKVVERDKSGNPLRAIGTQLDISKIMQQEADLKNALNEVGELKNQLQAENIYLQQEIKTSHNFEEIISQSKIFKKILGNVEQVASTDSTVLVLGETGTGKELLVRAIHNLSNRRNRPLVKVNCAALPGSLIESELFGHEKGAFTGALARKVGRFELADKGTIFLDEIGELPLELQTKLLRVLQEGDFERLGDPHTIHVDVRVIAATNRELEKALAEGEFRSDLYYRLNVFPITIPPLRERLEDIPLLVDHFVKKYSLKIGRKIESISQESMNIMQAYDWPGNIRELENVIERSVIISQGKQLKLGDWLPQKEAKANSSDIYGLDDVEKNHIIKILELTDWRVSGERGAAKMLNIKPTTLEARMKKFGIVRK